MTSASSSTVFDFACPGVLGDLAQPSKVFAAPVERSRDKNASGEERALGAARGELSWRA